MIVAGRERNTADDFGTVLMPYDAPLVELPESLFELEEKEKLKIDFDSLISANYTRPSHTQIILEHALRRKRIRFKREVITGRYTIDAVVFPNMAIEVDGWWHNPNNDSQETEWLEKIGFYVMRIYPENINRSNSNSFADMIKLEQRKLLTKYGLYC